MSGFIFGIILVLVFVGVVVYQIATTVLNTSEKRDAFWLLLVPYEKRTGIFAWLPKPAPVIHDAVIEIEPPKPEPELPVVQPPPDYGNVRPVLTEQMDLDEFGPEIHEFPEMGPPVTRYEDFNRRLFIAIKRDGDADWPDTTSDDFPTLLSGTAAATYDAVRKHLRPRYPVIIDHFGWWAAASSLLEQDPDYTDPVVEAYLAIPEYQRPVVVSSRSGSSGGPLVFMRYGFEDLKITLTDLRFYLTPGLSHLMEVQIGDRSGWLWLSVARMRQTVIRKAQADAALARANETARFLEEQTKARREGLRGNRYRSLWDVRASVPALIETESAEPSQAAQAPETEAGVKEKQPA